MDWFGLYFSGMQQDLKIALLPPLFCAIFRAVFIFVYAPRERLRGAGEKLRGCFRYGFWWGMDWNAYAYLVPLAFVTLPGAFFPGWFAVGDTVRLGWILLYALLLYLAFLGKMIFYYHFRDIYNRTLLVGRNADKHNLFDIFFHQHHGVWLLCSVFLHLALSFWFASVLLGLPRLAYPSFSSVWAAYLFGCLMVAGSVLFFYYFRFGGTLNHRHKPERDEIPAIVKDDSFFAKAVVDDFVALELVWQAARPPAITHTDEEAAAILRAVLHIERDRRDIDGISVNLPPFILSKSQNPISLFRRQAAGARIAPPKHIFFLLAEGHAQAPFDASYDALHLMDGSKAFRSLPHTFTIDHFLSAGMHSQTTVVGLFSGLYDISLELNENSSFWQGYTPMSLAWQMRKLGYRTELYYGGSMTWSSLNHYAPASGFERLLGGPEICESDAPRTWLGVYDHIFLDRVARMIREDTSGRPCFHFIYTTSNHGPFTIPVERYGFDLHQIMPEAAENIQRHTMVRRRLGCVWYADQALAAFIRDMQNEFSDSLFIVTGDHTTKILPFECGLYTRTEPTIREKACASFAISHPALRTEWFAGNTIGSHMHILPTLIELIAPRGFLYDSLFPSLFTPLERVVTPYYWLTREEIGDYEQALIQPLDVSGAMPPTRHGIRFLEEMEGWCEMTGWVARHSELLLQNR